MYGELGPAEIETLLRTEIIGHLGCQGRDRPYVVPITYVYDGQHVFGYTRDGMKLRMMRAHPMVCLQGDHIVDISNWQSAVVWGTFEELHGDETTKARQLIEDRFAPRMGGMPIEQAHGMSGWGNHPPTWQDAVLYRITLTTKSGRFEHP